MRRLRLNGWRGLGSWFAGGLAMSRATLYSPWTESPSELPGGLQVLLAGHPSLVTAYATLWLLAGVMGIIYGFTRQTRPRLPPPGDALDIHPHRTPVLHWFREPAVPTSRHLYGLSAVFFMCMLAGLAFLGSWAYTTLFTDETSREYSTAATYLCFAGIIFVITKMVNPSPKSVVLTEDGQWNG